LNGRLISKYSICTTGGSAEALGGEIRLNTSLKDVKFNVK